MLANPLMQSINNPMTVNSYLTNRASNAILSTGEQDSINRSVATLQTRLNSYFGSKLGFVDKGYPLQDCDEIDEAEV